MKSKSYIVLAILICLVAYGIWLAVRYRELPVILETPLAGEVIGSPLLVSGKAPGSWYFEGSFPIVLEDGSGLTIAQTPARAGGNWQTKEYVPFSATLIFNTPTTKTGKLVLEKDNPSGLSDNDAQKSIEVLFGSESGIQGNVLLGPICPVERMPPDPTCAPKPYSVTIRFVGTELQKQISSNSEGRFSVELPVGTYSVEPQSHNTLPSCHSQSVTVSAGAYTNITINCDTGIR